MALDVHKAAYVRHQDCFGPVATQKTILMEAVETKEAFMDSNKT